jgi:dienelactone hydrolase
MMKKLSFLFAVLFVLTSISAVAAAEIHGETVIYHSEDKSFEGWFAYDRAQAGKRPAILIVQQWKGLGPDEKKRAEMLAKLGYAVFALDIYGSGVRADNPRDASALAAVYKDDRELMRSRVKIALNLFQKHPLVDSNKIAAIGYCFGGTAVLELARSGADVQGVVSFHGGLSTSMPATSNIKASVLVLHGADDPFVPPAEVQAFEEEMRKAGADWQLVSYGKAVHSFTDFDAGSDVSRGAAYNKSADQRSWDAMRVFFQEIFNR